MTEPQHSPTAGLPITPRPVAPTALEVAGVLLGVALALAWTWLPQWPVGHDTPTHALGAAALANPAAFGAWLVPGFAPTSQGFVYLAAAFGWAGPTTAVRFARTAVLGLMVLAGLIHDRRAGVRLGPATLFAPLLSTTFAAFMGFDNFVLGLGLGSLAIALVRRACDHGGAGRAAVAALALGATAMGHAIIAALVGLWLLLEALALPGRPLRRALHTVAIGLPGAAYTAWALWVSLAAQSAAGTVDGLGTQRLDVLDQLVAFGSMSLGPDRAWGWLGWLALALAAVGAGRPTGVAWTGAAAFGTLYLAFPYHGLGWAFAQPRVAILAALVVSVSLRPMPAGRRTVALGGMIAGLVSATLALNLIAAVDQGRLTGQAVAELGQGPAGRTMVVNWAVPALGDHGAIEPTLWAGLWPLTAGGATPSMAAFNPGIHAVLLNPPPAQWPPVPPQYISRSLRCDVNPACAQEPARLADRIAVQGLAYDTVLVVGAPPGVGQRLLERGMRQLAPGRFVAQPTLLRLRQQEPERPTALTVRVLLPDTLGPIGGGCVPAGDTPLPAELTGLVAGPAVVEVIAHRGATCDTPPLGQVGWIEVALGATGEVVVPVSPPTSAPARP